ncbi:CRISPR-associated protein Cas5, partial [Burkholderia gladioli]|uniref:CRISPR-associated protein Cas5 n=1 Tax=Burkholderia gladioli TaxID=28095 RepID=UPI003F799592
MFAIGPGIASPARCRFVDSYRGRSMRVERVSYRILPVAAAAALLAACGKQDAAPPPS